MHRSYSASNQPPPKVDTSSHCVQSSSAPTSTKLRRPSRASFCLTSATRYVCYVRGWFDPLWQLVAWGDGWRTLGIGRLVTLRVQKTTKQLINSNLLIFYEQGRLSDIVDSLSLSRCCYWEEALSFYLRIYMKEKHKHWEKRQTHIYQRDQETENNWKSM